MDPLIYIFFLIILFIILFIVIYYFKYNIKNWINNEFNDIKFSNIDPSCKLKRWGCCNDNITTKLDIEGSNCRGF
jgi:hypothetical protein